MEREDEWLSHGIQRLHRDDVLGGSYFGTVWGPDALVQYASVFIIDRLLAYERYEPSPGDVVLNFFSPKKLTVASRFGRLTSQAFVVIPSPSDSRVRRGSYHIT